MGLGRDKETRKRNAKKYHIRNQKFIWQYLCKHPCIDCGEKDPIVLDFDHVRGKKKWNVSRMGSTWTYSLQKIAEEIAKCDVRCANCHRRVTYKRGNYTSKSF